MSVMIEVLGQRMTVDEARAVYQDLHKIFGAASAQPRTPSIFNKIISPDGAKKYDHLHGAY